MIIVCPLSDLPKAIREEQPAGVLTLLGPEHMIPPIKALGPERHLRIEMHDISEPQRGEILPDQHHIEEMLAFVDKWDQGDAPLIIHCWAGISRSTAGALITQAHLHPSADEFELADALRTAAPHAKPNRRLIDLADEVLGKKGRLRDAAATVWTDDNRYEGVRFRYPLYGKR